MSDEEGNEPIDETDGQRAGAGDMPYLAALAAELIVGRSSPLNTTASTSSAAARSGIQLRTPGEILALSYFRPEKIVSDQLVRRALDTTCAYIATYVSELAKRDIEVARFLADHIEIPWVRVVESRDGRKKPVVMVASLSEYYRTTTAELGELAGRRSLRYIREKKSPQPSKSKPAFPGSLAGAGAGSAKGR